MGFILVSISEDNKLRLWEVDQRNGKLLLVKVWKAYSSKKHPQDENSDGVGGGSGGGGHGEVKVKGKIKLAHNLSGTILFTICWAESVMKSWNLEVNKHHCCKHPRHAQFLRMSI